MSTNPTIQPTMNKLCPAHKMTCRLTREATTMTPFMILWLQHTLHQLHFQRLNLTSLHLLYWYSTALTISPITTTSWRSWITTTTWRYWIITRHCCIWSPNNSQHTGWIGNWHCSLAYAATADPNTMYLDQAMREPGSDKCKEAMQKEIQDHKDWGHWDVVLCSSLPNGTLILPAVWSMKCKRWLSTREIYKWKARLTIHGGKQQYGVNYWETYSPVVCWSTIRLFLILATIHKWHSMRQLDFVLAYLQAPVECNLYIAIPQGYRMDGDPKQYALKLKKISMVRNKLVVCGINF